MHKNEAIARVAEQAMEQIFDIAQYAISQITDGEVSDIQPLVQPHFQEIVKGHAPVQEHIKGRKTRTPKPKEIEPDPVAANDFVDEQKEIEPEPNSTKDYEAPPFLAVSESDADEGDDNTEFPNHPDDWFGEDVERARNLCRALLAKMMASSGPNETRKNLTETTGKSRATDFDAEDCMKFYRKFRNDV
jgi:hypothetical protein